MGLLEKLRPQPRWKHSDPSVRAAAVFELGAEDSEALAALAKDDADARVRRAAVSRLDDGSALADIARTDPDDDVRTEAIRGLAGLAAEAGDAGEALPVLRHLVELGRAREVVAVAKSAASRDVRSAAVDALSDAKSLGSVSRHADDSATRLRALQKLIAVPNDHPTNAEEIAAVAAKAEHTDVAVAALERVSDPEALAGIAQRARNKVAARRARTRVRELEDAAQPAPAEKPAVRMSEEDRLRALELLRRAGALVALGDTGGAEAELGEIRLAWAELQADTDEIDEALASQFEQACDAVREAIAERKREQDAEAERARAVAREQSDRVAICEELATLSGAGAADRVAELRARWDSLPPMPSEYAASLTRRFQDVSRAYEDRERRRVLAEAASSRLDTLASELEQLTTSEQPVEEMVARWRGLRRDAEMLREHAQANPQAAERLERAVAILEEKEHEIQERRAKQEQDNLRRVQQIVRHAESLAAGETLTLKAGDRALRDIREALEQRPPLPSKKDRQELHARLEDVRTKLAPRVQELRDADDWQRWANLQVQEELCAAMEALKATEDLDQAAHRMRELQGRWRTVAAAPRAQGEALWRRFKTAQDAVYAKCEAHFAAQAAERAKTLVRKEELCAKVEAIADSSDWVRTASEIQKLQAEWKALGAVPRGHEKAVWERFRTACDRFFSRRQEDLKKRKDDWSANLVRKESLCAQAEALAESSDWETSAGALKRLQAEWKTVGPVRKSKSEAIWHRFRTACDTFFDRYKHRDQAAMQARISERDTIVRELEALASGVRVSVDGVSAPLEGSELHGADVAPPADLYAQVQTARARWQQAPEVPRIVLDELTARYHQALGTLVVAWPAAFSGTDLDPAVTQSRMEKLVSRVEKLVPGQAAASAAALSPAERLAQQWRERLAANTITGGKPGESDETQWRAAEQEIRAAQQQWARLGPVPPQIAGPLQERFTRACRRFFDQRKRAS